MRCSPWKKSPSSLILNHSGALATHWMKPWAWKEGLFHYSGIYEGKWKHVIRMSCLGFALHPSSMRRWEVGRVVQHANRKRRSQQIVIFIRKVYLTWFLKQMKQKQCIKMPKGILWRKQTPGFRREILDFDREQQSYINLSFIRC